MVGIDELSDFNKGISGLMFIADLTDELNHTIGEGVLEIDHMSDDLFKLIAIVVG